MQKIKAEEEVRGLTFMPNQHKAKNAYPQTTVNAPETLRTVKAVHRIDAVSSDEDEEKPMVKVQIAELDTARLKRMDDKIEELIEFSDRLAES